MRHDELICTIFKTSSLYVWLWQSIEIPNESFYWFRFQIAIKYIEDVRYPHVDSEDYIKQKYGTITVSLLAFKLGNVFSPLEFWETGKSGSLLDHKCNTGYFDICGLFLHPHQYADEILYIVLMLQHSITQLEAVCLNLNHETITLRQWIIFGFLMNI